MKSLAVSANEIEVRDSKALANGRFLFGFALYCFQVIIIANAMYTNTSYLLFLSGTIFCRMTCTGWQLLRKELVPRMSL